MKNLKMPIEIYFEWRDKEGAAYPGEKGKFIWNAKQDVRITTMRASFDWFISLNMLHINL